MIKKTINQNAKFIQNLEDMIEPNFIFHNKPIKRIVTAEENSQKINQNKSYKLKILKEKIDSIENCNLKKNSKSLVMGSGNINSSIMFIGETPGEKEDASGLTFQGDVGILLDKMLSAINIVRENVYLTYSINFRPPNDRKPTSKKLKDTQYF